MSESAVKKQKLDDTSAILARLTSIESKLGSVEQHLTGAAESQPISQEPVSQQPVKASWKHDDLDRILFTHDQIQVRVKELGRQISEDFVDYAETDFVVVGLLSGVFMFMADLAREITIPHVIDFCVVSSYGSNTVSSANVKIKKDLEQSIEGKHVLIVDEMCDSGRTMASLKKLFQDRGARSVRTCIMLYLHSAM